MIAALLGSAVAHRVLAQLDAKHVWRVEAAVVGLLCPWGEDCQVNKRLHDSLASGK